MYPFEDETKIDYEQAKSWLTRSVWKFAFASMAAFYGLQVSSVAIYTMADPGKFYVHHIAVGIPLLIGGVWAMMSIGGSLMGVMEPLTRGKKIWIGEAKPKAKADAMSETVDRVDAVIEKRNQKGDWVSAEDAMA